MAAQNSTQLQAATEPKAADPRAEDSSATNLDVSFEFFPPYSPAMEANLWKAVDRLMPLNPKFVSVTYGAGGSTRERTHATVRRLLDAAASPPAAHLTCVDASREEVDSVVRDYADAGIRHIVALRGDPPGDAAQFSPHPQGYKSAAELVAGIKAIDDFEISVGAYPETHPEAVSAAADLDNLKRKIDAGASRAITQFFFEARAYLDFVERARAAGITVPIVPGILPIHDFAKMCNFAARCGAQVPTWLARKFSGLEQKPDIAQLVAASLAAELCQELAAEGVHEFHFYTLNRAELSYAACHILGLRPSIDPRPLAQAASA